MVAMLALKFAISSHFPLPKNVALLFRLSHMMLARAAQRVIENPRQMICPVLVERKRERERERERKWRHQCRAKIWRWVFHLSFLKNLHLSIGEEFCTFPFKNLHLSFSPSWMALSSHFPLPKTLQSSTQCAFFALSNGVTGDRSREANDRISGYTVFLPVEKIEKINQINTKNYWK